ncbi:hypothetical protein BDR26DRAFT_664910 [Obelidium mucronatum]|nr:hypothetical protein BDR26DRAFT_664910 [Obelidium mucronatum]
MESVQEKEELAKQVVKLKQDLAAVTADLGEMQAKVAEFEGMVHARNQDTESLSRRILKDRETAKSRLNECLREIEVCRIAIKKLQKIKTEQEEKISQLEAKHAAHIEELKISHSQSLTDAVTKSSAEMINRHAEEIEKLRNAADASKSRYTELEAEYRKAMNLEHHKYSELFKAFQELAEESNGIAKVFVLSFSAKF